MLSSATSFMAGLLLAVHVALTGCVGPNHCVSPAFERCWSAIPVADAARRTKKPSLFSLPNRRSHVRRLPTASNGSPPRPTGTIRPPGGNTSGILLAHSYPRYRAVPGFTRSCCHPGMGRWWPIPLRGRLERQLEPSAVGGSWRSARAGRRPSSFSVGYSVSLRFVRASALLQIRELSPRTLRPPEHPVPSTQSILPSRHPTLGQHSQAQRARVTVRGRSASVPAPFLDTPTSTEAKVRWPRPVGEPIAVRMWNGCPAAI
jgi:hypothetical protein